jgi:hypothetical protein
MKCKIIVSAVEREVACAAGHRVLLPVLVRAPEGTPTGIVAAKVFQWLKDEAPGALGVLDYQDPALIFVSDLKHRHVQIAQNWRQCPELSIT